MDITSVSRLVADEKECYQRIKNLRKAFSADLIKKIDVKSRGQALLRSVSTTQQVIRAMAKTGIKHDKLDPGHGVGHLVRDYINSLIIMACLDTDPNTIFVGSMSGVLHDLTGCSIINRYCDTKRIIRHAEVGAILLQELCKNNSLGLSLTEQTLISYCICAHTHFLATQKVECEDGEVRSMDPYLDTDKQGIPILCVWLARWIDRLDLCSPPFVARHYLTQSEAHTDFDGKNFYVAEFSEHMRPLFRTNDEIKAQGGRRTMLEHINMFHLSQTNNSVYGKHDFGIMVDLRDNYNSRLKKIIEAVKMPQKFNKKQIAEIANAWTLFCERNVEPSAQGAEAAQKIHKMFAALDYESRNAWASGFLKTMQEYIEWSQPIMSFLNYIPKEWLCLEPLCPDIRQTIKPDSEWVNMIKKY